MVDCDLILGFLMLWYCQAPTVEAEEGIDEYVLNFDSALYVCGDEQSKDYFDTSHVEVTRYNETTSCMSGGVNFLKGLNHNTLVELCIEKEFSGRYELVLSHEICDLCDELGKEESKYYGYLKNFGFPDECPFDAAEYSINDFVLYTDYLPINKANAGRYQITLNFFNNSCENCTGIKIFIGCLKVDIVIEPK